MRDGDGVGEHFKRDNIVLPVPENFGAEGFFVGDLDLKTSVLAMAVSWPIVRTALASLPLTLTTKTKENRCKSSGSSAEVTCRQRGLGAVGTTCYSISTQFRCVGPEPSQSQFHQAGSRREHDALGCWRRCRSLSR